MLLNRHTGSERSLVRVNHYNVVIIHRFNLTNTCNYSIYEWIPAQKGNKGANHSNDFYYFVIKQWNLLCLDISLWEHPHTPSKRNKSYVWTLGSNVLKFLVTDRFVNGHTWYHVHWQIGWVGGGSTGDARPPSRSIFSFIFMQFWGWRPPSGKSWIRHWRLSK